MTLNQEEGWLLKEKYNGVESEAFQADLVRLRAGEPLAYLIGHVPFLGCQIYLDSRPLIPRLETEYWVEKAIASIQLNKKESRVLDLCAGSGCVGVAVAKAVPETFVTFAEVDPMHLPTIKKNISENLLGERFQIVQSDLFEKVEGQFDFILSNPPYIDPALDRTEVSVKTHEPHLALYGGQSGMEIIEKIIKTATLYLAPQGQIWIEHEPEQVEAIKKCAEAAGFHVTAHTDQYDLLRYSILTKD